MTTLAILGLSLGAAASAVAWRAVVGLRRERNQRQEAERQLAVRSAELGRFVAGVTGAPTGLMLLDLEGRLVAASALAHELADLPPQGGRGRRLGELVVWPRWEDALNACRRGDGAQEFVVEVRNDEGLRNLTVRVQLLAGHGFALGIEDQSRIKRLESLRRDFVANVSHELKTPLAAILGYVETMLDDPEMPAPTRQRFLDKVARQSERLARLVGDLLTLSRLDEMAAPEAAPVTRLGVIVRETARDLAALAGRRNLTLTTTVRHEAPVRADAEALRQVVGNLVDNAIKYTPEGGRVAIALAADGETAHLEVADTGIGLSAVDQERVFERFYRVDRARSRDVGGTGLGLAIVKNTVRSLGGEVGVRSELGQGSTFWVRLPIVPDHPQESS